MKASQGLILAALMLAAPAIWAHHSYAMFDQTQRLTIQGTVKTLEWTNPHVWVWVDGSDSSGGTFTYGFESNAPSELTRFFGWTKHSLKVGDRITVEYSPLRSGNTGGALVKITFMDGRTLLTPRSDAPSGAANPSASKSAN